MQKFDLSNFDLDQDSTGVLKALLQHCIDISSQQSLGEIEKFNDNCNSSYEATDIWH